MHQRFAARTAASLALILSIFGIAASATAAPAEAATPTAMHAVAPGAAVDPQAIGTWVLYESNFKTLTTCSSRGAYVLRVYGGTHYGAVAAVTCLPRIVSYCPTVTKYDLYVRYNDGGGLAARDLATLIEPAQVAAAC